MVYLNYNSTLYLNKLFLLQLAEDVNIFVPTYPPLWLYHLLPSMYSLLQLSKLFFYDFIY